MAKTVGDKKKMSDKEQDSKYWDEEGRHAVKQPGSRTKLILIVVMVVVLAAGVAAGIYCGVKYLYLDKMAADMTAKTTDAPYADHGNIQGLKSGADKEEDCVEDEPAPPMAPSSRMGTMPSMRNRAMAPPAATTPATKKCPDKNAEGKLDIGNLMAPIDSSGGGGGGAGPVMGRNIDPNPGPTGDGDGDGIGPTMRRGLPIGGDSGGGGSDGGGGGSLLKSMLRRSLPNSGDDQPAPVGPSPREK